MDNITAKESRLEEFVSNPRKALWKLALPMMVGMMVQAIYLLVDTAFIGKWVGGEALAALGYVTPLLFILLGITFGLGTGVTTVIAQYIGQQDKKNADNSAEHSLLLGLIISAFIVIIGFVFGKSIIQLQSVNETVLEHAVDYFHILIGGSFFMIIGIFFRSILSGEGDTIFPMKVLGIGTVMNIVLDPVFIHYYGIKGAAIATVISQASVCLIFTYMIFVKKHTQGQQHPQAFP